MQIVNLIAKYICSNVIVIVIIIYQLLTTFFNRIRAELDFNMRWYLCFVFYICFFRCMFVFVNQCKAFGSSYKYNHVVVSDLMGLCLVFIVCLLSMRRRSNRCVFCYGGV